MAVHVLRLIFTGTLEKYPRLKLIIGHRGTMLPVIMARIDLTVLMEQTKLPHGVSQTLCTQMYVTTSGIFKRQLASRESSQPNHLKSKSTGYFLY